jgi:hypothetical protein
MQQLAPLPLVARCKGTTFSVMSSNFVHPKIVFRLLSIARASVGQDTNTPQIDISDHVAPQKFGQLA